MADDTNKIKYMQFLKNSAVSSVVCYMNTVDTQDTVTHKTSSIFT